LLVAALVVHLANIVSRALMKRIITPAMCEDMLRLRREAPPHRKRL
jgi:hypothetical protein